MCGIIKGLNLKFSPFVTFKYCYRYKNNLINASANINGPHTTISFVFNKNKISFNDFYIILFHEFGHIIGEHKVRKRIRIKDREINAWKYGWDLIRLDYKVKELIKEDYRNEIVCALSSYNIGLDKILETVGYCK